MFLDITPVREQAEDASKHATNLIVVTLLLDREMQEEQFYFTSVPKTRPRSSSGTLKLLLTLIEQ